MHAVEFYFFFFGGGKGKGRRSLSRWWGVGSLLKIEGGEGLSEEAVWGPRGCTGATRMSAGGGAAELILFLGRNSHQD